MNDENRTSYLSYRNVQRKQKSLFDFVLTLEEVLLVEVLETAHWIDGTTAILMSSTISCGTKDSLTSERTGNLIEKSPGLKCIEHICEFKVGAHLACFALTN